MAAAHSPGGHRPLVIVDGGVATQANLEWLREKNFGYLVNQSRRCRGRDRKFFNQDSHFVVIGGRAGKLAVRVRLLADPEFKALEADPQPSSEKKGTRLGRAVGAVQKPGAAGKRKNDLLSSRNPLCGGLGAIKSLSVNNDFAFFAFSSR
jgi:hypothetical protein